MAAPQDSKKTPHIVAIGGTLRPNSSTEKALRLALAAVAREQLDIMARQIVGSALQHAI
jgi:hypothetical protein